MDNRDRKELKQIAVDLHKGNVFTDRHVKDPSCLTSVFIPLAFLTESHVEKLKNDPPGMIFEYISKALPRSVNGMPCFLSFQMLSADDTEYVMGIYGKLKEIEKSVIYDDKEW